MESSSDHIDEAREGELWRLSRAGDRTARDALIEHYMPLARIIAGQVYRRRPDEDVEFDDYLQYAHIGLIDAIGRFRPDTDAAFSTFAGYRIRGAILNGVQKETERREQYAWRKRLQKERIDSLKREGGGGKTQDLFAELVDIGIGLALGYMLEDTAMLSDTDAAHEQGPYRSEEMARLKQRVREAVDALPEREAVIIRYHYFHQMSMEELGDILEISRGRVSQIHKRALGLIRERFAAGGEIDASF